MEHHKEQEECQTTQTCRGGCCPCASALPFVYLNKYTRLVVGVGGEDFGLLGGDGSVTLDEGSPAVSIPRERGVTLRRRRS